MEPNFRQVTIDPEFGIKNVITIILMKKMNQYCVNKFENEGFTEYERELRYTALGMYALMYSSWGYGLGSLWLGLGDAKLTPTLTHMLNCHTLKCRMLKYSRTVRFRPSLHFT